MKRNLLILIPVLLSIILTNTPASAGDCGSVTFRVLTERQYEPIPGVAITVTRSALNNGEPEGTYTAVTKTDGDAEFYGLMSEVGPMGWTVSIDYLGSQCTYVEYFECATKPLTIVTPPLCNPCPQ